MSAIKTRPERATVGKLLPIELADGLYWMGDCFVWPAPPGEQVQHAYTSAYLVEGTERSLLVDTGHPHDWFPLRRQLAERAAAGAAPLEWIFPTHPEVTHAGNLWRLMTTYPEARLVGDVRDHHLMVPEFADRFVPVSPGDELDLGDRKFVFLEALLRDLPSSMWGYDTGSQALFCSDGLGFGHYHGTDQCGKMAEEVRDLPIEQLIGEFLESSLYWTRLRSVAPHAERLRDLLNGDYPAKVIAPAHGSPIRDTTTSLARILDGLEQQAESQRIR
jgi:flavorubredoxin